MSNRNAGLLLCFLFFTLLYSQVVTPIAEIQDNFDEYDGRIVTLEAVVTIGAGVLHSGQLRAYVQDDSG